MKIGDPRVERILAGVLGAWILSLHAQFYFSAGALWRDEAHSAHQSMLEDWGAVFHSLRYDSFPMLYPSLLRLWSGTGWGAEDAGLRILGVLTGVALLASLWTVARLFGSRSPIVLFVLLAADPVWIQEGDSVRPYGMAMIWLLWAFASIGLYLLERRPAHLLIACIGSIFAVQTSYVQLLHLGVFSGVAFIVALRDPPRRVALTLLLPLVTSGISLLPYSETLLAARDWMGIIHHQIKAAEYLSLYFQDHSVLYPAAWIAFFMLAAYAHVKGGRSRPDTEACRHDLDRYLMLSAMLAVAVQGIFVLWMRVPPFPRYLLPCLLVVGLLLEIRSLRHPAMRSVLVVIVLTVSAVPTTRWLQLRHSNMDEVASVIQSEATVGDRILLSPWFVSPSFHRYFRGIVPWTTVPPLVRTPLTRYDLIRDALLDPESADAMGEEVRKALSDGGSIWLVSQRQPTVPVSVPERPSIPENPDGADYERFRSYWESEIVGVLQACCRARIALAPSNVWREEGMWVSVWSRNRK